MRGNDSVRAKRKQSIENIGLVDNMRKGAWVTPIHENVVNPLRPMHCLHWASLTEGVHDAWQDPLNATSVLVQQAIKKGLQGATVFSNRAPIDIWRWLVDHGNDLNGEDLVTTFIQAAESTQLIERGWNSERDLHEPRWTVANLGQGIYENKKQMYADLRYKTRWPRGYKEYARCRSCHVQMSRLKVGDESGQLREFWPALNTTSTTSGATTRSFSPSPAWLLLAQRSVLLFFSFC